MAEAPRVGIGAIVIRHLGSLWAILALAARKSRCSPLSSLALSTLALTRSAANPTLPAQYLTQCP